MSPEELRDGMKVRYQGQEWYLHDWYKASGGVTIAVISHQPGSMAIGRNVPIGELESLASGNAMKADA